MTVRAHERLEDDRQCGGGNADAVVLNGDGDSPIRRVAQDGEAQVTDASEEDQPNG